MKISTERLNIRPFIKSDKEALISIISNPQVMRFSLKGPITIEEARKQLCDKDIALYENEDYGMLAITRKMDNALIGYAGLLKQEIDGEQKIEISYRLHPNYWKQGFAIEAVRAILDYAFTKLKLKEIIAIIEPNNLDSIKIALKLGMKAFMNTTFHGKSVIFYQMFAEQKK
jgi:ribosomal-protein-alanine N-acetyltransferase